MASELWLGSRARGASVGGNGADWPPDGARLAVAPAPKKMEMRQPGLAIRLVFTLTTLLSGLLLFSIQPLFAKNGAAALLGGAPSVRAVALLFFQGALLVGI